MTTPERLATIRQFIEAVPEHTSGCDQSYIAAPGRYTTSSGHRGCTRECGGLQIKKYQAIEALKSLEQEWR